MNTRTLVCLVVAALLLAAKPVPAAQRDLRPPRFYVIFVDQTLSMNEVEAASFDVALRTLFAGIPPRSEVQIYPIGADPESAGMLLRKQLGDDQTTVKRIDLDNARRKLYQDYVTKRAELLKNSDRSALLRTCISGAIRQAAESLRERKESELEVVFLSDMLESCGDSVIKPVSKAKTVSLEKADISVEIRLASQLSHVPIVDLRHARVTAIIPASGLSKRVVTKPSVAQVRAFWRAVLDRCNDDPASYSLGTTIPDHLRPPKKR